MVSVGRPLPGFEVEVREPSGRRPVDEGVEGRIWVRGPSLMREYLHQPESTAQAVRNGWLDTGDLGFEQDGELFVTGRAKDVIIVRGANHSPEEIEAAVSDLPQVRTGCAAAVGHLPEGAAGPEHPVEGRLDGAPAVQARRESRHPRLCYVLPTSNRPPALTIRPPRPRRSASRYATRRPAPPPQCAPA